MSRDQQMKRLLDNGYELDDSLDRIDVDALVTFLSTEAYWGRWRARADIVDQLRSAWRVVAAYRDGAMTAFARAVSDGVAFAYLADVYVEPAHRGHGLGVAVVGELVEGGNGAGFRWLLHTADAHGLYAKFGFAAPDATVMERPAAPR